MALYAIIIATDSHCTICACDRSLCMLLQRHCKLSRGSVSVKGDREHLLKSASYVSLNGKLKKLQVVHCGSIQ
jgi:hypothetical protein